MRRARIGMLPITILMFFLVSACAGTPSPLLVQEPHSAPAGQSLSMPLNYTDELRGLPNPVLSDWTPFNSSELQLAINHPVDWSVKEQRNSVVFTSPDGLLTQLTLMGKGNLSPEGLIYDDDLPDARCSTDTNAHGITVRICIDRSAESRVASFIMNAPDGEARLFSLLTGNRGSLQVFEGMVASIRPFGS